MISNRPCKDSGLGFPMFRSPPVPSGGTLFRHESRAGLLSHQPTCTAWTSGPNQQSSVARPAHRTNGRFGDFSYTVMLDEGKNTLVWSDLWIGLFLFCRMATRQNCVWQLSRTTAGDFESNSRKTKDCTMHSQQGCQPSPQWKDICKTQLSSATQFCLVAKVVLQVVQSLHRSIYTQHPEISIDEVTHLPRSWYGREIGALLACTKALARSLTPSFFANKQCSAVA